MSRWLPPFLVLASAGFLAWSAVREAPDAALAAAKRARDGLRRGNAALERENERLRLTGMALPADKRLVAKLAAEKYDRIGPDDIIYVFPPDFGVEEDPADPLRETAPVVVDPAPR